MVPGNKVRVNGHKLKYGKFHSSIRKKNFSYCEGKQILPWVAWIYCGVYIYRDNYT